MPAAERNSLTNLSARCIVSFVLLGVALLANASTNVGRPFLGEYSIQQATQADSKHFAVTVTLRIWNYSGKSVVAASAELRNAEPSPTLIGQFDVPYNALDRGQQKLTGTFKVPIREWQSWKSGALPNFVLRYTNGSGTRVSRPIDSHRQLLAD
jgi:hypothetical protein